MLTLLKLLVASLHVLARPAQGADVTVYNASAAALALNPPSVFAECTEQNRCARFEENAQLASFGVYKDVHCTDLLQERVYANAHPINACDGMAWCWPALFEKGGVPPVVYVKAHKGFEGKAKFVFTQDRDYQCDSLGPVEAMSVLSAGDHCLTVRDLDKDTAGVFYPCGTPTEAPVDPGHGERAALRRALTGSSPDTERQLQVSSAEVGGSQSPKDHHEGGDPALASPATAGSHNTSHSPSLLGRGALDLSALVGEPSKWSVSDDIGCMKFEADPKEKWDYHGHSATVNASQIVDCSGDPQPCRINIEHGSTVTTTISWSVTVKVGIDLGIFNAGVDTQVGKDHSVAVTETITEGHSVDAYQKGYLGWTAEACIVPGFFSKCTDGPDRRGYMTVPKQSSGSYRVILVT